MLRDKEGGTAEAASRRGVDDGPNMDFPTAAGVGVDPSAPGSPPGEALTRSRLPDRAKALVPVMPPAPAPPPFGVPGR